MEDEIVEIRATSPQDKRDIKKLLSIYRVRQCILVTVDAVSILITFLLSLKLTGCELDFSMSNYLPSIIVYLVVHILIFMKFGCYSSLWRYAGDEELT